MKQRGRKFRINQQKRYCAKHVLKLLAGTLVPYIAVFGLVKTGVILCELVEHWLGNIHVGCCLQLYNSCEGTQ